MSCLFDRPTSMKTMSAGVPSWPASRKTCMPGPVTTLDSSKWASRTCRVCWKRSRPSSRACAAKPSHWLASRRRACCESVSPRSTSRTTTCGEREARARLADARAQLHLAELAGESSPPAEVKAAISCAVLAGIAASDAACCTALGRTNRSENHRDAVELLGQVSPGGTGAARQLDRLLSLKDESQYGFTRLTGRKLQQAVRRARALMTHAEAVVQR
jgi:hypothetical protein